MLSVLEHGNTLQTEYVITLGMENINDAIFDFYFYVCKMKEILSGFDVNIVAFLISQKISPLHVNGCTNSSY